jgi:hypothetical protein
MALRPCGERRATIKAHSTPRHPPSPLQIGYFLHRDTGGEWGVRLAVLAPPPPRDAINLVPTPVAIAALGVHRQFATGIRKDGEPRKLRA